MSSARYNEESHNTTDKIANLLLLQTKGAKIRYPNCNSKNIDRRKHYYKGDMGQRQLP